MNKKRAKKALQLASECLSVIGIDQPFKPLHRKELEADLKYLKDQEAKEVKGCSH